MERGCFQLRGGSIYEENIFRKLSSGDAPIYFPDPTVARSSKAVGSAKVMEQLILMSTISSEITREGKLDEGLPKDVDFSVDTLLKAAESLLEKLR